MFFDKVYLIDNFNDSFRLTDDQLDSHNLNDFQTTNEEAIKLIMNARKQDNKFIESQQRFELMGIFNKILEIVSVRHLIHGQPEPDGLF